MKYHFKGMFCALCASCALNAVSTSAHAAVITGVTVESFSSERGGFGRQAVNTLDGYLTNADVDTGEAHWQTNNDSVASITFNLGAVYTIDSFTLWNYMGTDNSDVEDVLVTYGETNALGSTLDGNLGDAGSDLFTFAASSGTTGEERTFSAITAQYIKFDIKTGYNGFIEGSNTNRVGFTEIEFNAVPEPSVALLSGLGLLMLLRRRR